MPDFHLLSINKQVALRSLYDQHGKSETKEISNI
jgi:hypothetical protein